MDATLERAAFSPAVPEEADAVCALIAEHIAWMDRMGLHGWNEQGYLQIYDRAYFACHAAAGRLYVLRLPSGALGRERGPAGTGRAVGRLFLRSRILPA